MGKKNYNRKRRSGQYSGNDTMRAVEIEGSDENPVVDGKKQGNDLLYSSLNFFPKLTSHFLPKFNNQSDTTRLCSDTTKSSKYVLAVSKKHSGSLVMAPPFYSKNGSGNDFSRVGCIILYKHFQAVWPGVADQKFQEWWTHAVSNRFCYSFECVTPRILGDHGATPMGAYMVLTCVSKTDEELFLSPLEVLELATKWRLALNETWYVSGDKATELEKLLHDQRWTMQDSDASVLLDQYTSPDQRQAFLKHGETQGEVLEGFVLMLLDVQVDLMKAFVDKYTNTMKPYHNAALNEVLELGNICMDPVKSSEFMTKVRELGVVPLNNIKLYSEPQKLKNQLSSDKVLWNIACEKTSPGRLQMLFKRLKRLYRHRVNLVPYVYNGALQLQLHIRKDEIFYSWPLHTMDGSTSNLFRGMVVTLEPVQNDKDADLSSRVNPKSESNGNCKTMKIVAIAKLKCLNYIWRTFGIRNRLPILLSQGGKDRYLKVIKRGFYKPWQIPQCYQKELSVFFSKWADWVLKLPPKQRSSLQKAYLFFLEDQFLKKVPYPFNRGCQELSLSSLESNINIEPVRKEFKMLILNFNGPEIEINADYLEQLGIRNGVVVTEECDGYEGPVVVQNTSPWSTVMEMKEYSVILCVTPGAIPDPGSSPNPDDHKRKKSMWTFFNKRNLSKVRNDAKDIVVLVNPKRKEEWMCKIEANNEVGMVSRTKNAKPVRIVLAAAALPPGGGKSSLFAFLEQQGKMETVDGIACGVASSDLSNGKKAFERKIENLITKQTDREKVTVIGYDKNIPDERGFQTLTSLLERFSRNYDIRVALIVPERLNHDLFWERVQARPESHIGLAIGPKLSKSKAYGIFKGIFFDQSSSFLAKAKTAPAAIVTDAFVNSNVGLTLIEDLTKQIVEKAKVEPSSVGASLEDMAVWISETDGGKLEGTSAYTRVTDPKEANWIGAQIEGNGDLHITLVPFDTFKGHPKVQAERKKVFSALAELRGEKLRVKCSKYHIAYILSEAPERRKKLGEKKKPKNKEDYPKIAFWEVDEIALDEDLRFSHQRDYYHITDRESISKGVPAKTAFDALKQIKAQRRGEKLDKLMYDIETEQHPLDLEAVVTLYK